MIDGRHYWQQQTKDSFTSSPDSIGDPRGTVKPTSQLWMGDGLNECGEQKRSAIQSTVDSAWVRVGHMQYVELVTAQQSSYEYGNNVENRSTIIHQPIFNATPLQSSHGLAGDAVADDNASRFPIEIHIWANCVSN